VQAKDAARPAKQRKAGLTRREILKVAGVVAAGATLPSLSGCRGGGPTATSGPRSCAASGRNSVAVSGASAPKGSGTFTS
jgi:hypothetical protein